MSMATKLIASAKTARTGEALRTVKADAKRAGLTAEEFERVQRAIAQRARKLGIEGMQ